MEEIKYIGEHLLPGNLGHFFTILSMVAALFATISYFISTRKSNAQKAGQVDNEAISWRRMGRLGFLFHAFSVLSIVVILFYIIWNNYFEYYYVYSHSSSDLPVYYMISCFWEGQEGSFLLWTFWNMVLGFVVLATGKRWEAPVMAVLCFTQIFLAAMLIGIYFFGYKIGSSPFILIRDFMPANPAFLNPNYLSGIEGSGLNPLLQNYWMVIHPPVLFLGFASTIMPFAYTLAALGNGDFGKDWVLRTLKWGVFSACLLGVGILMGGAWAYESLSFGGYWAWDPVENASLVPWIISICGFHTLLAYKHSGQTLRVTAIFFILTFLLILYSSFLTRSGILGDTSVHAFVDLGMSGQLLVFLFSFVGISIVMLIVGWHRMPNPKKEEPTYSKEFWLFVGTLLMTLLAIIVAKDTSQPVINKIFGTDTVIVDPVTHYNRYSIWFGIITAILLTLTQFLRYKSNYLTLLKKAVPAALLSLLFSGVIAYFGDFNLFHKINLFNTIEFPFLSPYFLLLFASLFTIIGNAGYIFQVLKGKIKVAGSAVAHIGFGLMLLGILISSAKKEVISLNNLGIDYGDQFDVQQKMENVFLAKNQAIQMGDYWLTYVDNYTDRQDTYYEIKYERKEKYEDEPTESFTLEPYAQINPKMGLISNPSTKHYWTKDIFTYISSLPDKSAQEEEAEQSFKEYELALGDTAVTNQALIILQQLNTNPVHPDYMPAPNDIVVGAKLLVKTLNQSFNAEPIYYIRGNIEEKIPDQIEELGMEITFDKVMPEAGKVKLNVVETAQKTDYVILKAMVFPGINLLWLGCLVMTFGFFMSIFQRNKESKLLAKVLKK